MLGVLLGAAAGCGRGVSDGHPLGPVPRTLAAGLLDAALQEQADSLSATWARIRGEGRPIRIDFARVRRKSFRSVVVPGLRYHTASYTVVPHTGFDVAAGTLRDSARLLASPRDWGQLVASAGWSPGAPAEAERACAEMLDVVGPPGYAWHQAHSVVTDERELAEVLRTEGILGRDSLAARAHAPRLESEAAPGSGGRWVVRVWALEAGRAAAYRCELAPGDAALTLVDSMPGAGYLKLL